MPLDARSVGEHAGVRRAPCDEDVCAKLGSTGRRAASCGAVSGGRRVSGDGDRSSDDAMDDACAHAKHMRRRTSALTTLTFPPFSIATLSSASSKSYTAFHTDQLINLLLAFSLTSSLLAPAPMF
jgi:hypothetical protein